MNSLEIMLSEKMKDSEPALDVVGSDRKVFQVAVQDFTNYVKFNLKLPEETSNWDVVEKMGQLYGKEPVEFESFLTVWVGLWLKKWRGRVKLLFGSQSQSSLSKDSETLSKAEVFWGKLACRQEMIGMVVSALIKNAEICGTEMLAEYLLKMELGKKNSQDINDKEQVLGVLNGALRRVREMALDVGPLLFVKVDRGYFAAAKQ